MPGILLLVRCDSTSFAVCGDAYLCEPVNGVPTTSALSSQSQSVTPPPLSSSDGYCSAAAVHSLID